MDEYFKTFYSIFFFYLKYFHQDLIHQNFVTFIECNHQAVYEMICNTSGMGHKVVPVMLSLSHFKACACCFEKLFNNILG